MEQPSGFPKTAFHDFSQLNVPSRRFQVIRDQSLDFIGESYASLYPNLHRYPATMIPQLGISTLERIDMKIESLLDPYCGSGSSFAAGLHVGARKLYGFDLNPLAVLISKVKFTRLKPMVLDATVQDLISSMRKLRPAKVGARDIPNITNIMYWFPKAGLLQLIAIKRRIDSIDDDDVRDLALLAFSETIRDVSFTRKNEFKLYRLPPEKVRSHKPDAAKLFSDNLTRIVETYRRAYLPLLTGVVTRIRNKPFNPLANQVDVVLTSPPYGDSRTTVAYGQFSTLTNEWLGVEDARRVDSRLMGGRRVHTLLQGSVISQEIAQVAKVDNKRALEVSSFYEDLGTSIKEISKTVRIGGFAIYIVGNRRVKDVQLSTDQFIAEQFSSLGYRHEITLERLISSKSMPAVNSPSNKAGAVRGTMTQEFVVICRKT